MMRYRFRLIVTVGLILSTLVVLVLSVTSVSSPYSDDDVRVSEALTHGTTPHFFGTPRIAKWYAFLDTAELALGSSLFYAGYVVITATLVLYRRKSIRNVRAPPLPTCAGYSLTTTRP